MNIKDGLKMFRKVARDCVSYERKNKVISKAVPVVIGFGLLTSGVAASQGVSFLEALDEAVAISVLVPFACCAAMKGGSSAYSLARENKPASEITRPSSSFFETKAYEVGSVLLSFLIATEIFANVGEVARPAAAVGAGVLMATGAFAEHYSKKKQLSLG